MAAEQDEGLVLDGLERIEPLVCGSEGRVAGQRVEVRIMRMVKTLHLIAGQAA